MTWLRTSLVPRILIIILGASSFAISVSGYYSAQDQRDLLLREIDRQGRLVAQATASFCTEPMLEYGAESVIETYAERVVEQDNHVMGVWITRADGKRIVEYYATDGIPPEYLDHYKAAVLLPEIAYDGTTTVEEYKIGEVNLLVSSWHAERALAASERRLFTQGVFSILIIFVLTVTLLMRSVSRPLGVLDRHARELGKGDLETPIRLNSRNELGRLARTLDDMRRNLKLSYEEIQSQNQELRELDRLKSQFLGNMSHEIRTPLNGILGSADLLLDSGITPEQCDLVRNLHSSGQALMMLIDDVLDFSKIEANQLLLAPSTFDPTEVLDEVISLLRPLAREKGLKIRRHVPNALHLMHADRHRLTQILVHLGRNAIKFTKEGSVTLRVQPSHDEECVLFEIEDTGIGILPEFVPRIFDAFRQVDSESTRRFGGAGIGLSIAKSLTQMMGGSIHVASEPDRGSRFFIELPRGQIDQAMARELMANFLPREGHEHPHHDASHEPHTKTTLLVENGSARHLFVLVVDDNAINRRLVARMVEGRGYEYRCAKDGAEALEAVQSQDPPFDIILMDCQMPVADGYEATRWIRQLDGYRGSVPIIAITANSTSGDRERCLEAGMNDYLTKPIQKNVLYKTIDRWMDETSCLG
ncbi:MAG: response regulator [Planctomycetes bacterium]|nr:response regulator [Planctomycetota bacterium]